MTKFSMTVLKYLLLPLFVMWGLSLFADAVEPASPELIRSLPELTGGNVRIESAGVLSDASEMHRQDPSNILQVGNKLYIYYAVAPDFRGPRSSKPLYMQIWCATSDDDGETWTEHGDVIGAYPPKAWHSTMRHAPYIVPVDGTYYLYFTIRDGAKKLAMATSANPLGPFSVDESGPKLVPGEVDDEQDFDSAMIDDCCIIKYKGKWHMYYKGRPRGSSPEDSMICLAMADTIDGPWEKSSANPLFLCHTANVWPHREGVAAISANPHYEILFAPDGVDFQKITDTTEKLRDSGSFCPDAFTDDGFGQGVAWGMFMVFGGEQGNFFKRWYLDMRVSAEAANH